jgi:PAS domain-containing protein
VLDSAVDELFPSQLLADLGLGEGSDHPLARSFPEGAVFVFDHDLRYVMAGGQGLAELGLSREALVGRTVSEVFPTSEATRMEPLYRSALAGETSTAQFENCGRAFSRVLGPVRDAGNAVIGGIGFTREVTQAREAEQSLRASERRFRLGFDNAQIGMALVELDGRFSLVNAALCTFIGYPADSAGLPAVLSPAP